MENISFSSDSLVEASVLYQMTVEITDKIYRDWKFIKPFLFYLK